MRKLLTIAFITIFSSAAVAESTDLLVTLGDRGVTFDVVNDANVTSMQFDVALPGVDVKSLDLSGCMSGVAGTHQGGCNAVEGGIRVLIYSMDNTPIPTGRIGQLRVAQAAKPVKAKVENFKMANADGRMIDGEAFVDSSVSRSVK